ncbi:MAG: HAD-IA family hydrolase [Candidatus Sedimenticola sp. 20ELBAFRAG]
MPEPATCCGRSIRVVLFDLDGTFADTAPDLAYALNQTLIRHGRDALPLEDIRPHVSHGGKALIQAGFQIEPEHPDFETYRQDLLEIYRENIHRETTLFPGMEQLLSTLEDNGIAWGIVTNKPSWLTNPLMQSMQLDRRAACIVSGDTTANSKPHPEPILHACELAGGSAAECLYVGDAERDIEAGRVAGTATLTALFGYIGDEDKPGEWGADGSVDTPTEIISWLGLPVSDR